jgi:hypothetical protein
MFKEIMLRLKENKEVRTVLFFSHNDHAFQLDLFFISNKYIEATQKFRAGLVMIDVLSKLFCSI